MAGSPAVACRRQSSDSATSERLSPRRLAGAAGQSEVADRECRRPRRLPARSSADTRGRWSGSTSFPPPARAPDNDSANPPASPRTRGRS
eukprot:4703731-Prymnesium_polylepis.2